MPYPKRPHTLPLVLSQDEVAQLINAAANPAHRILLMTLYATGMRRAEVTRLKIADIDTQRMVMHPRRQGTQGSRCNAQSETAGGTTSALAQPQT